VLCVWCHSVVHVSFYFCVVASMNCHFICRCVLLLLYCILKRSYFELLWFCASLGRHSYEVNLVHLTQTLSPSVSPPLIFFPPPLHLFSVTSLISHCLLTGSESLAHKQGWRDKFTAKRAHDKRNHPAPLFL